VDDLQWADGHSLELLDPIVCAPARSSCLFITTIRTGGAVSPEIAHFLASTPRTALGGLSDDDSRALVDALLTSHGISREGLSMDDLVREAAGHPLFLMELVRSLSGERTPRRAGMGLDDVL